MKKFFFTLLLLCPALVALAQEKNEDVSQRLFDAKIREFVYRLELTDQQKADFVPLYKRYDEEMQATVGKKEKYQGPPATSEESAARVKARIQRQQKAQTVRLKYVDEFAKVLDPIQLNRFYKEENQIQNKVNQHQKGHGPKGKGRNGGPQGGPKGGPQAPRQ